MKYVIQKLIINKITKGQHHGYFHLLIREVNQLIIQLLPSIISLFFSYLILNYYSTNYFNYLLQFI